MNTSSSSNIIRLSDSHNKNPIRKKPIRVGDLMFLAIPDSIVEKLHSTKTAGSNKSQPLKEFF